jgi:hypothetical protein
MLHWFGRDCADGPGRNGVELWASAWSSGALVSGRWSDQESLPDVRFPLCRLADNTLRAKRGEPSSLAKRRIFDRDCQRQVGTIAQSHLRVPLHKGSRAADWRTGGKIACGSPRHALPIGAVRRSAHTTRALCGRGRTRLSRSLDSVRLSHSPDPSGQILRASQSEGNCL